MDAETVKRLGKRQDHFPSAAIFGLRSAFHRSGERRFSGFVMDTGDPSRKLAVEILVDGHPVRLIRADAYVNELAGERVGDGCYGFSCSLHDAAISDSAVVEARVANLGTVVGMPISLAQASHKVSQISDPGTIRWLGGLRFSGWISGRDETAVAYVLVDGTLITRVRASAWSHVGESEDDARAVRALDFHLPERFADGRIHQIALLDEARENIGGSPLFFIAYPDGLREAVAGCGVSEEERLRAQLFDQLLPMSVPLSQYQSWRERYLILSGPSVPLRGAVIMVGPGAMDDTLESLHQQTHDDWIAASLPQTSEPTGLPATLARGFLEDEGANCEFVVFALAGTLFVPSALQRIAGAFAKFPNAQVVYTDIDLQSDDGSVWPLAFPAFDYERMLEQGYCSYLFALRRSSAVRLLEAGAANLYRLFNSVLDDGLVSRSDIVHLSGPTATLPAFDKTIAGAALAAAGSAHLRHKGIKAQVTQRPGGVLPAVQVMRTFERPRTTIIIPTRNRQSLLQGCIDSIWPAVERISAEILIVDNDSTDPETLGYLTELETRGAAVLRVPGEFNFPRLNNCAAKAAHGEVLCLLNNDVKALDNSWLEEMLSRIAEVDVGAVGALLVWPSGVVQHGGVVLGPNFAATHAFNDRIDGDVGYSDLLQIAHECSAVTAACLLTRRRDYIEVGGMDEVRFPVNFNDVDYCLKLRALGKRIVFTPYAKLAHLESASRGSAVKANHKERFERELQNLRAKWGSVLAADPYYSPMLSLDPIPFSALAWPARAMDPRINNPPAPKQIPPGF
jgi:O-antigen biosynthesis protein